MTITSKAATEEYRQNWDRIFLEGEEREREILGDKTEGQAEPNPSYDATPPSQ